MQVIEDKKYNINDVFQMLGKDNLELHTINKKLRTSITIDGFNVFQQSLRYCTFYQKGLTCCRCGRTGAYFKLCGNEHHKNRRHFILYSDDGTLMTKDHIFPRSKGGQDDISNMQTMCVECNSEKSDRIE